MSIAGDIAKKLALKSLVRQVSKKFGGDDIEWLADYSNEVILKNEGDIDKAILCFENLLKS